MREPLYPNGVSLTVESREDLAHKASVDLEGFVRLCAHGAMAVADAKHDCLTHLSARFVPGFQRRHSPASTRDH